MYQQDTSGAGKEEILLPNKSTSTLWVLDWSRDGRFILYAASDPKTKVDLWYLPTAGDRKPVQWLQTEFNETQGQFSPDGRWVAYTSDESGAEQIYVRPFPASGRKWPISNSGGWQPRWSGDGKELFYVTPDRRLMVAAIRAGSDFEASVPHPLFSTTILQVAQNLIFLYDVTADGRRFLINTVPAGGVSSAVNVVVNWQAGLKR
jgi:dipeptidyl aminopeptidase/acylaminoacyl peptidase